MQIKLKPYVGFVLKILIPCLVVELICLIGLSIGYAVVPPTPDEVPKCLVTLIIGALFCVGSFAALLIIIFGSRSKWFIFDCNLIRVCNKKGVQEEISVENIEFIHYRPFKFRYVFTIFFGELNECGAWKLFIKFKDSTTKILSTFSLKNVKKIKELYGDLLTIYGC